VRPIAPGRGDARWQFTLVESAAAAELCPARGRSRSLPCDHRGWHRARRRLPSGSPPWRRASACLCSSTGLAVAPIPLAHGGAGPERRRKN